MIESITFENYKAFKNGKLNIKPITILLGANSSGKSSIFQLLLLMEQTINNEELYESALKLNGKYINLGEDENLIKDQIKTNSLQFSFEFQSPDFSRELKRNTERITREIIELQIILDSFLKFLNNDKTRLHEMPIALLESDSRYNIENIIEKTEEKLKALKKFDVSDSIFREFWIKSDVRYLLNRRYKYNISDFRKINIKEYKDLMDLYIPLRNISFKKLFINYTFDYDVKSKKLFIKEHSISINKGRILSVVKENDAYTLHSDLLNEEILSKYILKDNLFCFNALELIYSKKTPYPYSEGYLIISNIFLSNIYNIFKDGYKLLEKSFNKSNINYIGPLRAFPQRYYFLDEANVKTNLNYYSGNNLAEILKKNKKVHAIVNEWLKKSLNLDVFVKEFKDIIHNIKIKQNGLDLDITDVGFGISQLLPILVQGFLASDNSITIIEQPEIHLHPKMQANLTDLFIAMINYNIQNNRYLLIETHSEYLLKRLRRRIAEGVIKNDSIGLYFIHPRNSKNKTAKIEEIKIESNGEFDWPEDFYLSDYDDTMSFFMNLNKNKS
jgi:predicted ATPase